MEDVLNSTYKTLCVEITDQCNLGCPHCLSDNRPYHIVDVDKLEIVCKSLPQSTLISLSGGEPTESEHLEDYIKVIKDNGHRVAIVTNGINFANFEYASKIRETGAQAMFFSLDGGDDDDYYQKLAGGKCAQEKLQAVQNAYVLNFPVVILSATIFKDYNESVIETIINLAKQYEDYPSHTLVYFRNEIPFGDKEEKDICSVDRIKMAVENYTGLGEINRFSDDCCEACKFYATEHNFRIGIIDTILKDNEKCHVRGFLTEDDLIVSLFSMMKGLV